MLNHKKLIQKQIMGLGLAWGWKRPNPGLPAKIVPTIGMGIRVIAETAHYPQNLAKSLKNSKNKQTWRINFMQISSYSDMERTINPPILHPKFSQMLTFTENLPAKAGLPSTGKQSPQSKWHLNTKLAWENIFDSHSAHCALRRKKNRNQNNKKREQRWKTPSTPNTHSKMPVF